MFARKNEATAAKRRVKIYILKDDGVTPADAGTTFPAVAAFVALTGTHHATFTAVAAGIGGNSKTITTVADGSGAGSLTIVGNAYTVHYQSGTTTMANLATLLAPYFTASGHTPADVLTGPGDTQGPLALADGIDFGWEVSQSSTTFAVATGTITACTRASGGIVPGLFQYEFAQPEINFTGAEANLKLEYPGFRTTVETCDMNDAADFDSPDEAGYRYGDTHRLHSSVLAGKVQNFTSGTLDWRDLLDAKTRYTTITGAVGRLGSIIRDLLP